MPSAIDVAKRALVGLLRTLAASYGVALTLKREAADVEVSGAYRKVSRRAHPGRGPEEQAARPWEDRMDVQTEAIAENAEGAERCQEEVPELQEGVQGRVQEEWGALGPLRCN